MSVTENPGSCRSLNLRPAELGYHGSGASAALAKEEVRAQATFETDVGVLGPAYRPFLS